MRKQWMALLAVSVLASGLAIGPMSVSAASSHGNDNASYRTNWWGWDSYWGHPTPADNIDEGNGNETSEPVQHGSEQVEKVIADGMKYLGTPYEFGSNRSTKTTFDCSDFVKWIFKETLDVELPSDSRKQGAYVKEHSASTVQTDWQKLKRGDLMFFMSYEGSDAAAYRKIDKESERITHVGIYLGNGKILHTYSKDSGGVRTDSFEGTAWEHRFLFGGSAL